MTPANEREKAPRRSPLDRLFFAITTTGWSAEEIGGYADRLNRHNAAMPVPIAEAFVTIDGKATGLLTHVSLMIAGLGLVAPLVANNDIEVGIVVSEIGVYLLIAVGCLRCLSVAHVRVMNWEATGLEWAKHELVLRRELYRLCLRAAIVFTIIVFLLLPLMFFWRPERHP